MPDVLRARDRMAVLKVVAECPALCRVRIEGEVDMASCEFIHCFLFPAGVAAPHAPATTEAEGVRLATFAADSKDGFVRWPAAARSPSTG